MFELVETESNILCIKDDPTSCIHVHEVNPCNSGDDFRITMSLSANMLALLGIRKLSVGYTKCRLYEWNYNKVCHRCGEHGHFKDKCKNSRACLRCGGDHDVKNCDSKDFKCKTV